MTLKTFDVVDFLESHQDIDDYLYEVLTSDASAKHIAKAFKDAERARAKLEQTTDQSHIVEHFMYRLLQAGYTINPPNHNII